MILSLRMMNSSTVEREARKKEDGTKKKAIEKNKNKIKVGNEGGERQMGNKPNMAQI